MNTVSRFLIFLTYLSVSPLLRAQTVVDELIDPLSLEITGGQVVVVFDDARPSADPSKTNFEVQHSSDIGRWTGIPTGVVSNVGNRYTLTADEPAGEERKFYRVIRYSTTAEDSDGDGLSDIFEGTLGTMINKADSDYDGFDDGFEFLYGARTDANDPLKHPVLTTEPRIEFVEAISESTEGVVGGFPVTLISDRPFFGDVKVKVANGSTAVAGVDFDALPSTIPFSGTSATLTINWEDLADISPIRLLMLEIEQDSGYVRGGQTRHTIVLMDNDAWWTGVLIDKYAQRNFRLKMTHEGTASVACFAAGAGNDGLPVLEDEAIGEESSQSVGVIPSGVFTATIASMTSSHFEVEAGLPASTNGLIGSSTGLTRTLTLVAIPITTPPDENGQEISPMRIIGTYTECLALPGEPNCAEQSGSFALVKDLPERPVITP